MAGRLRAYLNTEHAYILMRTYLWKGCFRFLHGGVTDEYGWYYGSLADAGCNVAANRTVAAEVSEESQGRSTACAATASGGRDLLRLAYRLSVEGGSPRVWLGQHTAPLLPSMDKAGDLS